MRLDLDALQRAEAEALEAVLRDLAEEPARIAALMADLDREPERVRELLATVERQNEEALQAVLAGLEAEDLAVASQGRSRTGPRQGEGDGSDTPRRRNREPPPGSE